MRYKITISYNGANYYGSQIQPELATIQEQIEKALRLQFQMPISLILASRTDKGVHALGQVGAFDLPFKIDLKANLIGINRRLPLDIRVRNIQTVGDNFHPRHDVYLKEYNYYIILKEEVDIFKRTYHALLHINNFKMFKKALKLFNGKHNFQAFAKKNDDEDYIRTIKTIKIYKFRNTIKVKLIGRSFLKQMIRIIIGTCVKVANNQINLNDIKEGLASGNRAKFNLTVPANGLVLKKIRYQDK